VTLADAIARLRAVPNTPVPNWNWSTARTPQGYEYRAPRAAEVCDEAGLALDVGVLACVAASEFKTDYPAYLLAGLACVINDAHALYPDAAGTARAPTAILNRVTRAKVASLYFGRQSGRWCSSFQAPTLRTVEAARLALLGVGAELAHGGRRWVDCHVQDGGVQAGKKLTHDAEAILRSRYREGWRLAPHDDAIDQYVLAVLTKDPSGVDLDEALRVLEDGRKRWGRG
jgi:hypothetical protein